MIGVAVVRWVISTCGSPFQRITPDRIRCEQPYLRPGEEPALGLDRGRNGEDSLSSTSPERRRARVNAKVVDVAESSRSLDSDIILSTARSGVKTDSSADRALAPAQCRSS